MSQEETHKVEIVGPVITNSDNPWRTQGDYREEQRQMRIAYRWAVGASVAAIITALCSIVLACTAIAKIRDIASQQATLPTQQQTTPMIGPD